MIALPRARRHAWSCYLPSAACSSARSTCRAAAQGQAVPDQRWSASRRRSRSSSACAAPPPAARAAWVLFAVGQFLFFAGRRLHVQLPEAVPPRGAVPVAGRRALPRGLPGADGRPVHARPPPQPGTATAAALIDSLILTVGVGADLVGRPDRAEHPRRPPDTARPRLRLGRLPARRHPAAGGGASAWRSTPASAQPAFYLLVGSIVSLLVTDFVYGLMLLNGTYNHQLGLDVGWMRYYLLWGAAALHPSMRTLEEPAPETERRSRRRGWRCSTVASLIAPGVQMLVGRSATPTSTWWS